MKSDQPPPKVNKADTWRTGLVIKEDGRGRTLGWPTANLKLDSGTQRPADGVYAAWATLADGVVHQAAVHVGPRPTVADPTATVEVLLLDFADRDLYGELISFRVVRRLRDIKKFDDLDQLKQASLTDCQQTREILAMKKGQLQTDLNS